MLRADLDFDGDGFFGEILKRLENAQDPKEKRVVLEQMAKALRSRTFADVAFLIEEMGVEAKIVEDTLRTSAMFYPEGEWKVLGDFLYPKGGPFMKRLLEAVRKPTGPR